MVRVMNMASQLKDVGEGVSNTTLMAKTLARLTTRFSTLQVAWNNVDPARQTLDNLQERLIREDARLESDKDASEVVAATGKIDHSEKRKEPRTKRLKVKRKQKKYSVASVKEWDISRNSAETKGSRVRTVTN